MVVIISVQAKVREFNYLFDGFFSEEGCYSIDINGKLISTGAVVNLEVVINIYSLLYLLICIAFTVTRPAKWSSFLK